MFIIITAIVIIIQLNSYLFTRILKNPEANYKAGTIKNEETKTKHLEA
jgi:hypothetical protein